MSPTCTAPPVAEDARQGGTPPFGRRSEGHSQAARTRPDIVEVWGCDSFPASDPPANW
jgi:hypothetical protein